MNVKLGKITLVDFVPKDGKDGLDKELQEITGMNETPKSMSQISFFSGSGGRFEDWVFQKIPYELELFQTIKVRVMQFNRFAFSYAIIVEGILSKHALTTFDHMNKQESAEWLRKTKEKFWFYWRENITGVLAKESGTISYASGSGIIHFVTHVDDPKKILGDKELNLEKTSKSLRNSEEIQKFVLHTGLLSVVNIFSNNVTLIGQPDSMLVNGQFNFGWIMIADFTNEDSVKEDHDILGTKEEILELQLILFWLEYRSRQIKLWKERIEDVSKQIKKFEVEIKNFDPSNIDTALLEKKGIFTVDFASILDEYRYAQNRVKYYKSKFSDEFHREFGLPILDLRPPYNHGLIYALLDEINEFTKFIQTEYEVLNNQFTVLTDHLEDLLSFANTQASLKVSKSNKKLQWTITIMTGVIIALTMVLAFKP